MMRKIMAARMAVATTVVMVLCYLVGCGETGTVETPPPVEKTQVAVKKYDGPPADLVVKNAKIVTIDKDNPRATSVAFKGETIIAVTANADIDQYIQEGVTEVVDAKGRLMIPGFNDAHNHFSAINVDYVELRNTYDPMIIRQKVAEAVERAKPGELISGGHWDHEQFPDKQWPTKELIDAVSPNNPVQLNRADGHSTLVNSYVLRESGITNDTPDPFGGEIQRDPETGEATGIFKETAKDLLKTGAVPVERTPEEAEKRRREGWNAAFQLARECGVTSVQLPPGGNFDVYQDYLDRGELTMRVYVGGRLTDDEQQLARYAELEKEYPKSGDWIRFGYLKELIDGTLGSTTAMFHQPYLDEPDKDGLAMMPQDEFERRILAADAAGFQIGIHAIGDRANTWVLDAFAKAREVNGERESRHRSEHAQVLTDEDILRFAELDVIASMQPTHCITDKRFAEKRLGVERCKGAYAWRRLLEAGVEIAFGTDYSVEPFDPMEGLYAAVTRKDRLGEEGDGWFPDQKLSMEKAIELYTWGSAYAEFMEDRKGMIKEGFLGDVVIVNQDLMTIPEDQIMKTKVDYTIVGGKIVFKRDEGL
jgi:predicted amidohydrolase YtcJ